MTETDRVKLTDQRDIAFAAIAQHALVNGTTFPSGFKTPDRDMEIVGDELVPVNIDEWEAARGTRATELEGRR